MINKDELLNYCIASVYKRIVEVNLAIQDADAALADDTKSSAGDKYETSREMVQQDLNRFQNQLVIAKKDLEILHKIDLTATYKRIAVGSLVQTNIGFYFIAISIGLVKLADLNIFVISSISPIGQVLMGKSKGHSITFNNRAQEILAIY